MMEATLNQFNQIILEGSRILPQAVWYQIDLPEQGIVVLDSFVLRNEFSEGFKASTHLRLMLMESFSEEDWEVLQKHHKQTYKRLHSELPAPPPKSKILCHVVCTDDAQTEHSYTILREMAERIAKLRHWVISDIAINKPNIRLAENLDIPLYKIPGKKYLPKDLPPRPIGVWVNELQHQLVVYTKSYPYFLAFVLLPVLLMLFAVSVIMINNELPLYSVIPINVLALFLFSIAFMVEYRIIIDNAGVELECNSILFWWVKRNRFRDFMPWNAIEEIQTMSSSREKTVLEDHVAIVSDNHIISVPTKHAHWIWMKIMVWLSENREQIGKQDK
ncbi:hypothetical protein AAG747_20765 [Rapidithrix thailandica]|uniref:Uncharacterized protein n=1 Tax=Rapidithrix thailandica TaxID=413964 RepID=A0AAW9SD32_9BACT